MNHYVFTFLVDEFHLTAVFLPRHELPYHTPIYPTIHTYNTLEVNKIMTWLELKTYNIIYHK